MIGRPFPFHLCGPFSGGLQEFNLKIALNAATECLQTWVLWGIDSMPEKFLNVNIVVALSPM